MGRKRTKEDFDILIAQRSAVIDKANCCIENLDRAAAMIEIFVGDDDRPVIFYIAPEELREFLNKEIGSQKSLIENMERYQSPVFA